MFDEIYGAVTEDMAKIGRANGDTRAKAGVYKIHPVVIGLMWNTKGGDWISATPEGGRHLHHHAGYGGAFGGPCFGGAGMGPAGVQNREWFHQLWDEDPVKWARAIHAFFGTTTVEHGYTGVWGCGELVEEAKVEGPKLRVTKLPTPTIRVTRVAGDLAPDVRAEEPVLVEVLPEEDELEHDDEAFEEDDD